MSVDVVKPKSMEGWAVEGSFAGKRGSKADVAYTNAGAVVFRDVVKLDDSTDVRKWVNNLLAEAKLSDEEHKFIESNPSIFDKELRDLHNSSRDRLKAEADKDDAEVALPSEE